MQYQNDADNPALDQELKVGDTVYFAPEAGEIPTTPLTVLQIGSSKTDWDYKVQSPTGNIFSLTVDEIITPEELAWMKGEQSC